jgi:hypothetical protein
VAFDLAGIRRRKLTSNSRPRDVAGKLVQIERNSQALLAGHVPIQLDLPR